MAKDKIDKNSEEYLLHQVANGRHSLVLILVFTLVNLLMVVLDSGTYFLFSASVPYYVTLFAKGIDNDFVDGAWDVNGTFTIIALVISAVILLLYLLCWLFSKKRGGWLVAALVLFILDTLALALFTFTIVSEPASNIVDFVFHAWAIWELFQAARSSGKLKNMVQKQTPDLDGCQYACPEIE